MMLKSLIGNVPDESGFIKKFRLHQGQWRTFVLNEPAGVYTDSKGNCATVCNRINNGKTSLKNFISKDISDEEQENGVTKPISDAEYIELLKEKGNQNLIPIKTKSESQIAVQSTQFQYGVDYFVSDFVTVEHHRFGIRQNKIQLVGMIESFDRNGRNLTPTFKEE